MRRHATRLILGILIGLQTLVLGPAAIAAQIVCDPARMAGESATPPASPAALADAPFPDEGGTVTIFAAASLTDAFGEIASNLEAAHPGLEIVIQTAGSQTLVTQLREGAGADVLATANTTTMTTAVESGLVEGEPVTFTSNRLVIVTTLDNPAGIGSIDDLANDDVLLVAANESVPAGTYARQALCAYNESGAAPDGFLDGVAANVVSEEEDVRNVLAKVQLGEADAGIVYASDAVAADLAGNPLKVIEFPAGVPATATYPIAAVTSGNLDLANAFIAAILAPEGQAVLADYGFTPSLPDSFRPAAGWRRTPPPSRFRATCPEVEVTQRYGVPPESLVQSATRKSATRAARPMRGGAKGRTVAWRTGSCSKCRPTWRRTRMLRWPPPAMPRCSSTGPPTASASACRTTT